MSEHNEDYTIKKMDFLNENFHLIVEDKNKNEYVCHINKKTISIVPLSKDESDQKLLFKFLREFQETCQN